MRDDRVTIRFWAFGNEGENVQALIPEFERDNPGIHVMTQQIPWTAAHEKLLTGFAGDATPDVCQLGNTWIPEFAVLNALEPLGTYVTIAGESGLPDFFSGVVKMNVIDSTLYGIPWYVDTRVLYYRKDILADAGFSRPPRTWAEMLRMCQVIKTRAKSRGILRYPIFLPTNEWVPVIILGVQAGGHFLKDGNTRGNFSGKEFTRAFSFLTSMYRDEYSPTGMSLITNLYNSFADGLICMYITGPWNIGEFRHRIPPALQDAWMTAPLPSLDDQIPGASLPLGTSLVIFRASKHKSEAWTFIRFLTARQQMVNFYRITGNLPPRQSAWTDSSLRANVYMRAFYDQLQRVDPLPLIPEWEQVVIRLQQYVELAATGTKTVDETLHEFDREVDRMLEKRRWIVEQHRAGP